MVLDRDEVPSEAEVARLMGQILDGLNYLHTINVAHLDIKVRTRINVFLFFFSTNVYNSFLGTFPNNNNRTYPSRTRTAAHLFPFTRSV